MVDRVGRLCGEVSPVAASHVGSEHRSRFSVVPWTLSLSVSTPLIDRVLSIFEWVTSGWRDRSLARQVCHNTDTNGCASGLPIRQGAGSYVHHVHQPATKLQNSLTLALVQIGWDPRVLSWPRDMLPHQPEP